MILSIYLLYLFHLSICAILCPPCFLLRSNWEAIHLLAQFHVNKHTHSLSILFTSQMYTQCVCYPRRIHSFSVPTLSLKFILNSYQWFLSLYFQLHIHISHYVRFLPSPRHCWRSPCKNIHQNSLPFIKLDRAPLSDELYHPCTPTCFILVQ